MDDFKLVISSSPHINDADTIEKIMSGVVIALAPATLAGYTFGFHAFAVIIVSVLSAVLTEWIFQKLRNKPLL